MTHTTSTSNRRRHARSLLTWVLVASTLTAIASLGPRAQADPVIIPGTYTMTVEDGVASIGELSFQLGPQCSNGTDDDLDTLIDMADAQCVAPDDGSEFLGGHQAYVPPMLEADIAADGTITVPADQFTWEAIHIAFDTPLGIVEADLRFVPVGTTTGTLNPATGAIDLDLDLYVDARVYLGAGYSVRLGRASAPISTHPTTGVSGGLTGSAFNPNTLAATLVENEFTLPTSDCYQGDMWCDVLEQIFNEMLGLPTSPGESALTLDVVFDESPIAEPTEGPDLRIDKSHDADFVIGQTGKYTIDVRNVGQAATTGVISVRDDLPDGLTFPRSEGEGWFCWLPLQCTYAGLLDVGESAPTLTIAVDVVGGAPEVVNKASVSTVGDTNPANDTDYDPTTVIDPSPKPDLKVDKGHRGRYFAENGEGVFTVDVTNVGEVDTTSAITVVDTLPPGLGWRDAEGEGWLCMLPLSCTHLGVVAPGESLPTLEITVYVSETAVPSAINKVIVSTPDDPNPDNDKDSDKVLVLKKGQDFVQVRATGAYRYENAGAATPGAFRVAKDQFGVSRVSGSGRIPSAGGGVADEASVTIDAQRFLFFGVYFGNVSVRDPGVGTNVSAPFFFSSCRSTSGTNAATCSADWFKWNFPANPWLDTYRVSILVEDRPQ